MAHDHTAHGEISYKHKASVEPHHHEAVGTMRCNLAANAKPPTQFHPTCLAAVGWDIVSRPESWEHALQAVRTSDTRLLLQR